MKKTLTDSAVKAMSSGDVVWDKVVPGLHVRARGGGKGFFLFYRTKAGVERRPKLGDCSIVSIAQAREDARANLAIVAAGGDPMADRAVSKAEPTVNEFFERCYAEHWAQKKRARDVRRLYDARIAPRLGNHRIRGLSYDDIAGLHRALAAIPYEANRCLSLLSKLLNLAERHGARVLDSNPCRHVARYPELSRRRYATPIELAKMGPAFDTVYAEQPDAVTFIALVLFTGMRPVDVRRGRRERLERLEVGGVLRMPDAKSGQKDVYFPPQALALVDKLPAPSKARDGLTPLVGVLDPRNAFAKIKAVMGVPDLRPYDMKRTFATVALAGGASNSLIGEVLGLKTVQTTKVYAQLLNTAAQDVVQATGAKMQNLLGGA